MPPLVALGMVLAVAALAIVLLRLVHRHWDDVEGELDLEPGEPPIMPWGGGPPIL